jgi:hypothetical protein
LSSTETAGYVALNERPQGGHAKLLAFIGSGKRVLARVRPLLRADGRLVLTTPNVANWAMRLGLLAGRRRYSECRILERTHLHLFTRETLVEAIGHAAYRVVELDFTVPVPGVKKPAVERHRARDRTPAASTLRVSVRRSGDAALT